MIKPKFNHKTHVDEYLNDNNISIYSELTENEKYKGLFEPLAFFNNCYFLIELINVNCDKPTRVVEYLFNLDLEPKKKHFLIKSIIKLIDFKECAPWVEPKPYGTKLILQLIKEKFKGLDEELYPKPLQYKKEKINTKKENAQSLGTLPKLKPSSKKGARLDLIRILYALYDLKLIEFSDTNEILAQNQYFNKLSEIFDCNLNNHSKDISQALENSEETNIRIFEEMIKKMKERQSKKLERKKH